MKLILSLAMLLVFALSSTAFAEERPPVITVSGEGIIEVEPNRATISVGIISRDKDVTKVQNDNAQIATKIINSAVKLGVERKNIRTGNYTFRQIFHTDDKRQRIFDGYEVNNTVTIVVDDLNLVGKIIDNSLASGANTIDSLEFGIRDKGNLQNEAIRLAVRNARTKAEIAAAELGKTIVGVRTMSINSGSISTPRYNKMAVMEDAVSRSVATPIESGTLSCSASVHIEFEISK